MKRVIATLLLSQCILTPVMAADWVKDVYIVGIQANCDNKGKLRLYFSNDPAEHTFTARSICTKADLKDSLTRTFLVLSQGAMSLGQKVDLEISDKNYLNDLKVRPH